MVSAEGVGGVEVLSHQRMFHLSGDMQKIDRSLTRTRRDIQAEIRGRIIGRGPLHEPGQSQGQSVLLRERLLDIKTARSYAKRV